MIIFSILKFFFLLFPGGVQFCFKFKFEIRFCSVVICSSLNKKCSLLRNNWSPLLPKISSVDICDWSVSFIAILKQNLVAFTLWSHNTFSQHMN